MAEELKVSCPCGLSIPVSPGEAGTEVTCRCGSVVPVPRLAELRRMAGKDPYAANPAERIERMERTGEMKLPERCVGCLNRTDGELVVDICCERTYAASANSLAGGSFLDFGMVFGLAAFGRFFSALAWGLQLSSEAKEDTIVHGREVVPRARLRVCATCRGGNAGSQEVLVQWLRTVPIYAELLDMYPEAEFIVVEKK